MTKEEALLRYVLRLGDNALVLAQRLIELVTHGPELEEEMANANFALDYLGQARMFYSYAGELEGKGRSEDDFAFMRHDREFENFLLLEQPNGHFGDTVARTILFDVFYHAQLEALSRCTDERLAAIAARAVREIRYHVRHLTQWLVRLGDGTAVSHRRMQQAIDDLWRYTGEFFAGDETDDIVKSRFNGPDLAAAEAHWRKTLHDLLREATLDMPEAQWMDKGGRDGCHTEHFGLLIAEMQTMQRSYPGLNW